MKCFECGEPARHEHHVVPRAAGGTKTVPLCKNCHALAHGGDPGRMPQGWGIGPIIGIPPEVEAEIVRLGRSGLATMQIRARLEVTHPAPPHTASGRDGSPPTTLWPKRQIGRILREHGISPSPRGRPRLGARPERVYLD